MGINFREGTANQFSDVHHCAVSDARISDFLVDTVVAHLNVLSEKVTLWDSNVAKVHISVLLRVEADLRADVSSFDPRQPVVVLVLDLNQERVHSVVLAFDDSLCEHQGVVGQERELSGPVLGRADSGRVEHPLFGLLVVLCDCFETSDI